MPHTQYQNESDEETIFSQNSNECAMNDSNPDMSHKIPFTDCHIHKERSTLNERKEEEERWTTHKQTNELCTYFAFTFTFRNNVKTHVYQAKLYESSSFKISLLFLLWCQITNNY